MRPLVSDNAVLEIMSAAFLQLDIVLRHSFDPNTLKLELCTRLLFTDIGLYKSYISCSSNR